MGARLCVLKYMLQHRLHMWEGSQSPHHGNWKVPAPQSIWNVMIFGSLALGALPKGLSCQACKVHPCLSWPQEPTGQRNLSMVVMAAAVTAAQI